MAGRLGTVSALARSLVRVEVAHLVSSSSMVSRAYLVDRCLGVTIESAESGYWLVSALSVMAPDPDSLRVRAADKGGIPVENGVPRLLKVTLGWDESTVEVKNPVVLQGQGVGAVSLAVPASFGETVRSGGGPRPVELAPDRDLKLGDEVAVVVFSDARPVVRWARVSSDPGFGGVAGAVALDVGLTPEMAGAPVFELAVDGPRFYALAEPLDSATSVQLPPASIRGAIG